MNEEVKKVRVVTYDGSIESAQELVKNLKIDSYGYHYNVITKDLIVHDRCFYRPGDCYHIPLQSETFEAKG